MTAHRKDEEIIATTHNTARFCVENPHVSIVLLIITLAWGLYGYLHMPHRKDPEIPVRVAVAMCPWPGVRAEKIEELVTRKIEAKISENEKVERVESVTRTGLTVVTVKLVENTRDTGQILDDINLKLNGLMDLPEGAGPIQFIKDFGDPSTLMLTVASPIAGEVEIDLRSREIERIIRELRAGASPELTAKRITVVGVFSYLPSETGFRRKIESFARFLEAKGLAENVLLYNGPGLALLEAGTTSDDKAFEEALYEFVLQKIRHSEINPDLWIPVFIRDPATVRVKLAEVAGSKYTYRDLEVYTDEIVRTLQAVPRVSKATRWGVQKEAVFLEYSQERLASYGLHPWRIKDVLSARNVSLSGGMLEFGGKNLIIDPSGEFKTEQELGDAIIVSTGSGAGAYLRDLVEIERGYEAPPQELNFLSVRDKSGAWQRLRAITLAVNMRAGEQIGVFSREVDEAIEKLRTRLPEDLVVVRTSDQPLQVEQSVNLFMNSLYEAMVLVVLVALIGFWEWRSALLMALAVPITLAMTFGMMHALGIDLQQVSIASLIIALGLLVDDPVVANDAIRQELDHGRPPETAAWLGPTKLARAILYATITNIVAYLPYLILKGDTGRFLYSLPVVLTCSLVASRIVSMSFIPFLGYYLLKPKTGPSRSIEEMRTSGFSGLYYRIGGVLIDHRRSAFLVSLIVAAGGIVLQLQLKPQYFPKDLSYLSYVDLWLPEDAPVHVTNEAAALAEQIIQTTAADLGARHPQDGKPRQVLKSLTSFVGGGGPRFWFSVEPELSQPNYAQILIEVTDSRLTELLLDPLQNALMPRLPGVRVDTRQLESGPPVGFPVQVRVSGHDMVTLRDLAERLKKIFDALPNTYRVKDNWGAPIFRARLAISPDKANLAGLTNLDVARSSSAAMTGFQATTLRDGRLTLPVIVRARTEDRATIGDIRNLYVYAADSGQRVPLGLVSTMEYGLETEKIVRRSHFRTINVSCFPAPGVLPSEVMEAVMPQLEEFKKSLPPGYFLQIGGEQEEQVKGFDEMGVVLLISVLSIYVALVFQFRHAIKPLIVFSALPYGMAGAFASLSLMGLPFGFMAYLGIISLIGVIVSHIIVLFDFIEEKIREGEDLRTALLDAGIMRLRPVLVTVAATVCALFPLALNGGPLWEPLCYAQIGGLTVAVFVTLLMVPVLYSIAVFDLKLFKQERP